MNPLDTAVARSRAPSGEGPRAVSAIRLVSLIAVATTSPSSEAALGFPGRVEAIRARKLRDPMVTA